MLLVPEGTWVDMLMVLEGSAVAPSLVVPFLVMTDTTWEKQISEDQPSQATMQAQMRHERDQQSECE